MLDFENRPGFLFVIATLLPLASFVLLLLAGGLRNALRSCREESLGHNLYTMLGGDIPPRWPAYIATGAIALAFVLCLAGFITYTTEHAANEARHEELHEKIHELQHARLPAAERQKEIRAANEEIHRLEARWEGDIDWIRLFVGSASDQDRGTALKVGFRIDSLSAVMFVMVTLIASLIHLFSIGYMADEGQKMVEDHQVHGEQGHLHRRGRFGRFFMYLSLFCFSMLNLVLADNLFQIFVSWELVGICSYLLIGFYYERQSASNASNKAFITNRIGDAGFIIGLLIVWTFIGTFNFQSIFRQVRAPVEDAHEEPLKFAGDFVRLDPVNPNAAEVRGDGEHDALAPGERTLYFDKKGSEVLLWPRVLGHFHKEEVEGASIDVKKSPEKGDFGSMPYWMLVVAGLGIFLGCVGKSAQFPLQVWLPDAMEGPTPVSALIHAATMVAAGVYLVGRCYPLFTPEVRLVIAYTGAITLFVAATIAIVMRDIKKVLAYSTVSQLGYMMLALGVGGWVAGLFHLVTHAFFKALLFLGSGSVIHGCHHEQDMMKMGGLYPKMKITALTMLMGVLAISGVPGFSGWYSKDAVLASCLGFGVSHPEHMLLFLLPLVTAGITTFYMFRMWFLTFAGKPKDDHVHEHAHESPWVMTVPLIVLGFFSVTVAWGSPFSKEFYSGHFPFLNAESSALEHQIHHSQPEAVTQEFGLKQVDEKAKEVHGLAGNLALAMVVLGLTFAALLYYYQVLDPEEAKQQFPRVHAFLESKWYFDEVYSALLVRPAMVVAHWCKAVDGRGIDTVVDGSASTVVKVSRWDGLFDNRVIDGAVNLVADVCYGIGARLRGLQTGYLRSYVLFLVLAAVAIFALLSYYVASATAG